MRLRRGTAVWPRPPRRPRVHVAIRQPRMHVTALVIAAAAITATGTTSPAGSETAGAPAC